MIEIRELSDRDIADAHQLSVEVFGETAKSEKYSIVRWKESLAKHGLLLGAFDAEDLVGFKFGYERVPGEFHSWLGGVREAHRRRGIMQALTAYQESWVRANGFVAITVHTFRDKFPAMYAFLERNGYQVAEITGSANEKSHFRKNLTEPLIKTNVL